MWSMCLRIIPRLPVAFWSQVRSRESGKVSILSILGIYSVLYQVTGRTLHLFYTPNASDNVKLKAFLASELSCWSFNLWLVRRPGKICWKTSIAPVKRSMILSCICNTHYTSLLRDKITSSDPKRKGFKDLCFGLNKKEERIKLQMVSNVRVPSCGLCSVNR